MPLRIRTPLILLIVTVFAILAILGVFLASPATPDKANHAARAELIDSGSVVFRSCSLCHGREGQGERCPPLIYSDFVQGDRDRLIRFVFQPDTVRVNGALWRTREMPSLDNLTDFEIAAVLTYLRARNDSLITCTPEDLEAGTWAECTTRPRPADGIASDVITPAQVAAVRRSMGIAAP